MRRRPASSSRLVPAMAAWRGRQSRLDGRTAASKPAACLLNNSRAKASTSSMRGRRQSPPKTQAPTWCTPIRCWSTCRASMPRVNSSPKRAASCARKACCSWWCRTTSKSGNSSGTSTTRTTSSPRSAACGNCCTTADSISRAWFAASGQPPDPPATRWQRAPCSRTCRD